MLSSKLIEIVLFSCLLLSGFYAGIGFFVAMGGNPAITLMSDRTFVEYWQHTDHFMAARMKVFGPLLLLTMVLGVIVLLKDYQRASFWLMAVALAIIITDMGFTFSTNIPLNQVVHDWDIEHLPSNVRDIKCRIVKAFNTRTIFMIGSFVMTLLAVWLRQLNRM